MTDMTDMTDMTESAAGGAPLVSVLLAVHNGARHLEQSIQSILSQSCASLELIVVDDGSTDTSAAIIAAAADSDSRVRALHNHENLGLAASLNRALRVARGSYIARQDADDLSEPERLSRQLAMFQADPSLVLVGSAYRVIDPEGEPVCFEYPPLDDLPIRWQMLFHNAFVHSSVMFPAELVARHALYYDERLRYAQDYDLWSRFLDHGAAANCPVPLIRYRVYPKQRREMQQEQQQNATAIAVKNLAKLGIALSHQQMVQLRQPDAQRVACTGDGEPLRSQALLLQIMSRFVGLQPAAAAELALVRWRLSLGCWALSRCGVGYREIASLIWGVSRLDARSYLRAACCACLSKLATLGQRKPGSPYQVEEP